MLQNHNTYKYCILTSVKLHNIGDYLIFNSIVKLLDVENDIFIIEDKQEITQEIIDIINKSKALIISGSNLYGKYNFSIKLNLEIIDKINVPIIPIGVGGQSPSDTDYYQIKESSLKIIKKIHQKCKIGSVRDLHTYITLRRNGIDNVILTGCPTLFNSLRLPDINYNKKSYIIFCPQFYKGNRFTILKTELNLENFLLKILYGIINIFENFINDYYVKKFINKNNDFLCLIQQKRDKIKLSKWKIQNKIVEVNNADEYMKIILNSSYLYSFRLHAGMFALSYGIPVTFYGIDSRIKSFCNTLGIKFQNLNDMSSPKKTNYTKDFEINRLILAKNLLIFFEMNGLPVNEKFKNEVLTYNK